MITIKPVEQSNNYNCGAAALESLLGFYDVSYDHRDLEKLCESSPEHGTSPEGLIKGIESLGIKSIQEISSWEKLESHIKNQTPVMVEWYSDFIEPGDGHYSVVFDISTEEIYLMDPEIGKTRVLKKDDFLKRWSHSEPANWSLFILR